MRKIKGIKRKGAQSAPLQSPAGEDWKAMESRVTKENFPSDRDLRFARFVVHSLSRYQSDDALQKFKTLTIEGTAAFERILAEVGFELDFPEEDVL